jgi:hypothetical protein
MSIEPLHTTIEKSIQTMFGTVVLESPKGFPHNYSNLYCLTPEGKVRWEAEKPDPNTLFSRVRLGDGGENLSAYTIGGHACELELKTGKLLSYTSIK